MTIKYTGFDGKQSNIVTEKEFKKIAKMTINQMADTVALTAGPFGSTIIVEEPQVGHFMTKDGFSVLKNMFFPGPISNVIHSIVTEISEKLVLKVGDGSTSSILAARNLFNILDESTVMEEYRPKLILDTLYKISDEIGKEILNKSIKIGDDLEELKDIATVSVNNDAELGQLISTIYKEIGKEGFITVKVGTREKTYHEISKGFQIEYGYLDKILINNPETEECVLNNPDIIVFDAPLNDTRFVDVLRNLLNNVIRQQKKIVIVAPGYGKVIKTFFREMFSSFLKQGFIPPVNIISLPNTTQPQYDIFEDLAIKTGAKIIRVSEDEDTTLDFNDYESFAPYLGQAGCVKSNNKSTTIFDSKGLEKVIDARITSVKTELEKKKSAEDTLSNELYHLKKRLAVLTDKLATIYVGGISEQAKLADKALIDDAVAACKSAIKFGYVDGCNFAIIRELNNTCKCDEPISLELKLSSMLASSIIGVYNIILNNAGVEPVQSWNMPKKPINLVEGCTHNVINSAETEVEILKNICSIIGLLITSKGFLTKQPNSCYENYDEENKILNEEETDK